MDEFFGIPMSGIALVVGASTVAVFLFMAWTYWRNPVMFRYGLRNLARRRLQTALIVFGLMLATVIMTAALGTGDTVANGVTRDVYRLAGETDILVVWDEEEHPAPLEARRIPLSVVEELRQRFADDPDIEGILGTIRQPFVVVNPRTRLNEPFAWSMAFPTVEADAFGGLRNLDGNVIRLQGNEVVINEDLADALDAVPGDRLLLFYEGQPVEVVVKAIGPTSWMTGIVQPDAAGTPGFAAEYEFIAGLTGYEGDVGTIVVSTRGGVRDGVKYSPAAVEKLEAALAGQPYEVVPLKEQLLELANLAGSFFTTFFMMFGAFSIAAGVLLIFLIFILLAAERKPEMGIARAVGARRRHLVEAFLAEGMGYDLAAALVGLGLGVAVTVAMIAIINSFAEAGLGVVLEFSITARSLLVAFCVGVLATFLVISSAAARAARLNITAAIRDVPESRPLNPEEATWFGFLRGTLNALVAGGFLVIGVVAAIRLPVLLPWTVLAVVAGLVGPFLFVLRGANFALPRAERLEGERLPLWPFWWGITAPPYALAVLLTWVARERRPRSMPWWVVLLGILVPPLGVILVALQDVRKPIPWAVGFATVGLTLSALLFEWGLREGLAFPFGAGVSLVGLWVAAALRYFRYHERAVFTTVSLALLAFWMSWPTGVFDRITGELSGDVEMFFLSGLVLITAGTFLVVYNADLVVPLLARAAGRARSLLPAVRIAITYPLTSRMRTVLTVAMIGLIVFALVVMATLTENFERIFLSDDARGGWDVMVLVNENNPIGDLSAALREAGVKDLPIDAVGLVRRADASEAQVRRPEEETLYRYSFLGVDDGFLHATELEVKTRAAGYGSGREVWEAMTEDPSLAVVDQTALTGAGGFGVPEDLLHLGLELENGFEPFELVLHDPGSGREARVKVIGVVDDAAAVFFPGIFIHLQTFEQVFADVRGETYFVRLGRGAGPEEAAKRIESALLTVSAESLPELLDEQRAAQAGFLTLFQGFLGLGLVVGIAALGVIAIRAVVERRQQIGILRAIGFRRSLVSWTFLLESAFVALSGIGMGGVLGVLFSWVLFTSGGTGEEAVGRGFAMPWLNLATLFVIAFASSMVMTILPARGAAGVAPAEALRFE